METCEHGWRCYLDCPLCRGITPPTVPPDNGAAATRMTGVPREPTEAMQRAGAEAVFEEPCQLDRDTVADAWRAMWDAYHAPNR